MSEDLSTSIGDFAELVAAGTPTPGGGSVAAYCGMLAASLGRMMCHLTLGKVKYVEVEPQVKEIEAGLDRLGGQLRQLISDDAASFEAVLSAYRLPKESDEQKAARKGQIDIATVSAVDVPLETARTSLEVLRLLGELAEIGNPNAFSDLAVGSRLAETAVKGAYYNIGINLKSLADKKFAAWVREQILVLIAESENLADEIESAMVNQME